jgi:flagellar hook-basal body complex protein FliE
MSPIPAIGALGPPAPLAPISATSGTAGTAQAGGSGFGDVISNAIANTERAQSTADDLAVKAATGDLTDVHDYLAAATEASLTTQLTVAVRNKAIDAFNEIMRLQA